jgi:hypothetical protein
VRTTFRWIIAGVVSILVCLLVAWAVAVALPTHWIATEDVRWMVATAAGLSAAGVVGLWGKTFATAVGHDAADEMPDGGSREKDRLEPDLVLENRNAGILSTGRGNQNYQGKNPMNGLSWPGRVKASGVGGSAKDSGSRQVRIRVKELNDGIIAIGDDNVNVQERG